jgi:hypothetical protein
MAFVPYASGFGVAGGELDGSVAFCVHRCSKKNCKSERYGRPVRFTAPQCGQSQGANISRGKWEGQIIFLEVLFTPTIQTVPLVVKVVEKADDVTY